MKVLVTGASGFVGRSLIADLVAQGHQVWAATRTSKVPEPGNDRLRWFRIGGIGPDTEWHPHLQGIDAVVHLAARAHVMRRSESQRENNFLAANYLGTRRLADACRGRIKHFVYLSSIGVHGSTSLNGTFDESSPIDPDAPYARSKAHAEVYLHRLTERGELNCRILRPPLVYGPDAPGNLARLVAVVRRGAPLPFAWVNNRRSLIGVRHLTQAIVVLLSADKVSRFAYVIADRDVVSIADMIQAIATGLDRPARLWPVPIRVLKMIGAVLGRQETIDQLVGNLEVDASAFRGEFGSFQIVPTLQGLRDAAGDFSH